MEIYKISLDKWDLYNQSFLTLFQGTCCVHGYSVGGARPFCALATPAFGERGCPQSV